MKKSVLMFLSVTGQLLSVFPFVVLCEGVGLGRYIWWHYPAFFAVICVFYVWGRICALWAVSPRHSREFRPKAIFLSRAAITLPVLIFIIVCASLRLSGMLYLYLLPAAIIMYHGGHATAEKEYADVFTRGWFALYFVAAVVTSVLLWFTHKENIRSIGGAQLCIAFGVLIIISAVLVNQTTIDTCTHQRDAGRAVLPNGLRSYNGALTFAVVGVIVGACIFVVPVAQFLMWCIKNVISWLIMLIQSLNKNAAVDDILSGESEGGIAVDVADNSAAELLTILLAIGILVLIIVFRRQIAEFFREMIAPLFRIKDEPVSVGYTDEVSDITGEDGGILSRRKVQQKLYKQYRKEQDAVKKYRLGYRLMLIRLTETPFAPVVTDNTDIHCIKGENGFRTDSVEKIVSIYNDVRYSGRIPTVEEIRFEEEFIENIRRY